MAHMSVGEGLPQIEAGGFVTAVYDQGMEARLQSTPAVLVRQAAICL